LTTRVNSSSFDDVNIGFVNECIVNSATSLKHKTTEHKVDNI